MQIDLLCHSQVSPPGAVLAIYLLQKMVVQPGYIALCLAVTASILSMLFLRGIFRREFGGNDLPEYLAFLYVLIPGVEIYYAATLDALVAACLLGVLYFFLHPKAVVSVTGAFVFLFLASFMKFVFLFILPVLAGFEILKKRAPVKTGILILGLVVSYVAMQAFFNYNYLNSFMTVSVIVNPDGFRLFNDPASHVFTGLAGILEIILFFGPFLGLLAIRGMRLRGLFRFKCASVRLVGCGFARSHVSRRGVPLWRNRTSLPLLLSVSSVSGCGVSEQGVYAETGASRRGVRADVAHAAVRLLFLVEDSGTVPLREEQGSPIKDSPSSLQNSTARCLSISSD